MRWLDSNNGLFEIFGMNFNLIVFSVVVCFVLGMICCLSIGYRVDRELDLFRLWFC